MGKMETLTPCKIETLEQIDTQFVRIDYVREMNVCSRFGKNPFTGDFWAKGWNITFCVTLFIYLFIIFFSWTNVQKRPLDGFWRAMAQTTRNRASMCLFGVIKWKIETWPIFTPQNPKNLALNRQFPAKMMKHETPSISESTKPIEMKI